MIMFHGCPPFPDAWGRLTVVTPFHHLSGDSTLIARSEQRPLRHLVDLIGRAIAGYRINFFLWRA
jgi:hypothetical protein